ncbi:MAG: GIY-YIG nuclease family protein [Bacteroidetes bacterium]|nr:GIY-YIG nuclease family protein [Bacteroidota bacterium]
MKLIVYILYSATLDRYYVGYTGDTLEERLRKHNSSKKKGFTSTAEDWKVVHTELYDTKVEAMSREKEIKQKKSRQYIEILVKSTPI